MSHYRYFFVALALLIAIGAGVFFYRTFLAAAGPLPEGFVAGTFAGVSLRIELATTTVEKERGLGGRTSVPKGYGMLFVFPKDGFYGFWMKDTLVPLDMFWLDDQGRVVSVAREVATTTYPHVFYPAAPARYVLETAAGFARGHQVATGTPLRLKNLPAISE